MEDKTLQPYHCTDQTKEWTIETMNDFSIKLGFVQCEIQQHGDESVEIFKEDHEVYRIKSILVLKIP